MGTKKQETAIELEEKGTRRVRSEFAKKLTSLETGETVYFINKDHGIKRGFMAKMNFRTLHPTEPDFCQINIELNIK